MMGEALETGKARAKLHAEYIKVPASKIRTIAIDEIEMIKSEKGSKWYIKTPLAMLRQLNLEELKRGSSPIKNNELDFGD
jgi:hypothetical protein